MGTDTPGSGAAKLWWSTSWFSGWSYSAAELKSGSGELRTQKLKSHLVRTSSSNVLLLKPVVGQYIAIHATLTARDFFLAYFYPSGPFTSIFSKTSPDFSLRTQTLNSHPVRTQSLNVLPLKPGVGQYIAIHATLTARDFFLISTFRSIQLHFFQNLSRFFLCWLWLSHGSCVRSFLFKSLKNSWKTDHRQEWKYRPLS